MPTVKQPPHLERDYFTVPNALARDPNISARAKAVWIFLRSQTDGRTITQEAIGEAIGATDRTARAAIKDLEKSGWISVLQSRAERGKWAELTYVLHTKPTGGKILPPAKKATGGKKLPPVTTSGNSDLTGGKILPPVTTSENTPITAGHDRWKETSTRDTPQQPAQTQQTPSVSPVEEFFRHKKTKKPKEEKPPFPPTNPQPQPTTRQTIPHNWAPTPETHKQIALSDLTEGINTFKEIKKFIAYHQKQGTTSKNYDKLFIGWCIKAAQKQPPTSKNPGTNIQDWL